ncbi:hypothetical protein K501DRAFT_135375, partial [Backusella circina FSU 941]
VDPIIFLLISVYARSRLLRWRMGWLPARPVRCSRCDAEHSSRNHLIGCLDVARRLGVSIMTAPNPLDYFLNKYLPEKKNKLMTMPLSADDVHLYRYWPALNTIMFEIEQICLPDGDFTNRSAD